MSLTALALVVGLAAPTVAPVVTLPGLPEAEVRGVLHVPKFTA